MQEAPIGIFDSGVGGLTVWADIARLLPAEDTIYLADSAHAPYGEKPPAAIVERSLACTRKLLDLGAKLIVVACNTATTNAISTLRAQFPVPFIGIEPAIKPAALQSASGTIGVLATRGTLSSALFATTSRSHARGIRLVEQEGKGLVQAIESGKLGAEDLQDTLRELVQPMLDAGVDHLVLGCTHYPFLKPILAEVLPSNVRVVDCGEPVARQTRAVLERENLLSPKTTAGSHLFYSNADPSVMQALLSRLGSTAQARRLDF